MKKNPLLRYTDSLRDENARLRAELETLKPKPVVQVEEFNVYLFASKVAWSDVGKTNLKLTFHDGKLVAAEVIG